MAETLISVTTSTTTLRAARPDGRATDVVVRNKSTSSYVTVTSATPVTAGVGLVIPPGTEKVLPSVAGTAVLYGITNTGTASCGVDELIGSGTSVVPANASDVVLMSSRLPNDSFDRFVQFADGRQLVGDGTAAPVDIFGTYSPPAVGIETFPRNNLMASSLSNATQRVSFTYFVAPATRTLTTMEVGTGTTAAATVTAVYFGLYSEDPATGDLTKVADTANDASLMIATSTAYPKAFQASVTVTRGRRYATAVLQVATTVSTYNGVNGALSSFLSRSPRTAAILNGQNTLPASVAAGSLSASSNLIYTYLS